MTWVKEAKRWVNEKGYNGVSEGEQVRCVKEAECEVGIERECCERLK